MVSLTGHCLQLQAISEGPAQHTRDLAAAHSHLQVVGRHWLEKPPRLRQVSPAVLLCWSAEQVLSARFRIGLCLSGGSAPSGSFDQCRAFLCNATQDFRNPAGVSSMPDGYKVSQTSQVAATGYKASTRVLGGRYGGIRWSKALVLVNYFRFKNPYTSLQLYRL